MNNNITIYPVIYECNRVILGAKKSIIVDLQRKMYLYVPKTLAEILLDFEGQSIDQIYDKYSHFGINLKYNLDFLVENEIIFLTEKPDLFPKVSLFWDHYSKITNCIIDYKAEYFYFLDNIISQLQNVHCENIQFRFFDHFTVKELENLLKKFNNSRVVSIELVCPKVEDISNYIKLLKSFNRIFTLILYSVCKKTYNQLNHKHMP